jgi:hypothetical protein
MKKIVFAFATFALAFASAANSYRVTLFSPSTIGGQELKAGEYRVEVKDNKVILKADKGTVQADVKVEEGSEKFANTSIRYLNDGKNTVKEIRIGGTNKRLVLEGAGAGSKAE